MSISVWLTAVFMIFTSESLLYCFSSAGSGFQVKLVKMLSV